MVDSVKQPAGGREALNLGWSQLLECASYAVLVAAGLSGRLVPGRVGQVSAKDQAIDRPVTVLAGSI